MSENFLLAFSLTLLAGLSTGIGSLIAFFSSSTNRKFLAVSLGFSAGVMIYVSFVEIFNKAKISLIADMGYFSGTIATVISFFGGILLILIIDKLIPEAENPHEIKSYLNPGDGGGKFQKRNYDSAKLLRMGLYVSFAITLHNFPEGLATFIAALNDPHLGVAIAISIAIHNIPEGISVSVPIYHATGSKKKALLYSFASGLAEPIGALIGYFFMKDHLNNGVMGIVFAGVAGIMVFISLDELLPAAREYGEHHLSIYGLVAGMAVMAISLILFL